MPATLVGLTTSNFLERKAMNENFEIVEIDTKHLVVDEDAKKYYEKEAKDFDKKRMMSDLFILSVLKKQGNLVHIKREILCYSYSPNLCSIKKMTKSLLLNGFKVHFSWKQSDRNYCLKFSYFDDTSIESVVFHQKMIVRLSKDAKCNYDGWETTIETGTGKPGSLDGVNSNNN